MRSFVCLYYGNSGSSWLMETLNQGPQVLVAGFEPVERWGWDVPDPVRLEWMRTALAGPSDRDGPGFEQWLNDLRRSPQFEDHWGKTAFRAVGFKLSAGAIRPPEAVVDLFGELGTRVIVLTRHSRLKHALSLYRYHEEGRSQFDRGRAGQASVVPRSTLDRWLDESATMHEEMLAFRRVCAERLPAEQILDVEYEDFVSEAGKRQTIERVSEFLGIDPTLLSESRFDKATPDDLRAVLANYRTLKLSYTLRGQGHLFAE